MKQTIDYSQLKGLEKHLRALDDIQDYLGTERFGKTVTTLRREAMPDNKPLNIPSLSYFIGICDMFLGITGYPVLAFYNHTYVERKTEADLDAAHKALLANAVNEGEG